MTQYMLQSICDTVYDTVFETVYVTLYNVTLESTFLRSMCDTVKRDLVI